MWGRGADNPAEGIWQHSFYLPSFFTRERQQVLMAAVFAFDAGKAVAQIAAIQITADHLFDIRPPESVIP